MDNKDFIKELGKQAGLFVKQARANFLAKLFKPNIIGKELPVLRKQIGGYLQSGNTAGLAKHLGTDASNIEQQLQRRAQGLYGATKPMPVGPATTEYLGNIENIRTNFSNPGQFGQNIAETRANLANLKKGPGVLQEAAQLGPYQRFENLRRLQADRIAMSGRHGTPELLQKNLTPVINPGSSQPNTAFKGFGSASATTPTFPGQPGSANWWSGYSEVGAGYGSSAAKKNPFSYVAQSPVSELAKYGPYSPSFHPHLARDSRNFLAPAKFPFMYHGNNPTWSSLPYYERVFTHPGNVGQNYFNNLYKALPSGGNFQRVGGVRNVL